MPFPYPAMLIIIIFSTMSLSGYQSFLLKFYFYLIVFLLLTCGPGYIQSSTPIDKYNIFLVVGKSSTSLGLPNTKLWWLKLLLIPSMEFGMLEIN